jgi:hypothetical protein
MWLCDTGKAFFSLLIGLWFSWSKGFFVKKIAFCFDGRGILDVFGSCGYLYITLPMPTSPFPPHPKKSMGS